MKVWDKFLKNIVNFGKFGETGIHLVTAVSLIVGVYLVLEEMKRTRDATSLDLWMSQQMASLTYVPHYGEDLATVLAKACHTPEDLTDTEVVILNKYFRQQINWIALNWTQAIWAKEQAGNPLADWKGRSGHYVLEIMSYPSGRKFLSSHPFISSEEAAKTDEVLQFLQSWGKNGDTSPFHCENQRDWLTP